MDSFDDLMSEMRREFVGYADELVGRIDAQLARSSSDDPLALAEVVRAAHTLKGAGGTFGYPDVTQAAAAVEYAARQASSGVRNAGSLELAVGDLHRVVSQLDGNPVRQ